MSTSSSSQRLIAIATVAIIALLGLNGYLIYSKVNQDKLVKKQNAELIEAEKLQTDLQKEYYQALSDLEEMRGSNEELNGMIEEQKGELKKQKDRISVLLKSETGLKQARTEIGQMKSMAQKYLNEIKDLKQQNEALSMTNLTLQEEKKTLTGEIQKERIANDELVTARAALTSEKERLESEKANLSKKVNIASVVRTQQISVEGYRLRNSGKEAIKKRAKSLDGLKICFNTLENQVVKAGQETFFVRIVNPLGETIVMESAGSGVLQLAESDTQIRYSSTTKVDFQNMGTTECLNWQPEIPFSSGEYQIEIYNKGHLSGSSTFSLK